MREPFAGGLLGRSTLLPPLCYLDRSTVSLCAPAIEDQLQLAGSALIALANRDTLDMPEKFGVHPRPGAVIHAMPAWVKKTDNVGVKWISTYSANAREGEPPIDALIILNDAATGHPTHILDGNEITAMRTAAVSGVAMRLLAPDEVGSVGVIGAGRQGASHALVIAHLFPGAALLLYDRHPERSQALAESLEDHGLRARPVGSARAACTEADVVVTAAGLGSEHQALHPEWLKDTALVVSIDADTYASADLAEAATLFVVDDDVRFATYCRAGEYQGFPPPSATIGSLLQRGRSTTLSGRSLVLTLGAGVADVIFAAAIAAEAQTRGTGTVLAR